MSKIDWQKVESDYEASTLDMRRVADYARTVATILAQNNVAPDNYTDAVVAEFEERQRAYDEIQNNDMKRRKPGLLQRLFGPEVVEERDLLSESHIGYWVLLTESEVQLGDTVFNFRDGTFKTHDKGTSTTQYALLADGTLHCFRSRDGCRIYGVSRVSASASGKWSEMSEDDILLLDHRLRHEEREKPYNRRTGEYWCIERHHLSTDNYLITGRKGGGCRKLVNALLEEHGIEPPRTKKGKHKKAYSSVDKTYTLTSTQLQDGCTLRHTFKSGDSQTVQVYPGSRPRKVITIKNRKDGSIERIMLLS